MPSAAARASALVLHRLGGLAHAETVEQTVDAEAAARRAAEVTERAQVEAAVARRSVERLTERRAVEASREAERIDDRRRDDVALEIWRRRR